MEIAQQLQVKRSEQCKFELTPTTLHIQIKAFHERQALRLIQAGVDYQVRETFESAMTFGEHVLKGLGYEPDEIAENLADVRQRDDDRLGLQLIGGITAGRSLMRNNQATPEPAPLTRPKHAARALNPEATEVVEQGSD